MAWAANEGCRMQSGFRVDSQGETHTLTRIAAKSGKAVVVPGIKQTEHLEPTMVSFLDRRLGLDSPWFSPDADED